MTIRRTLRLARASGLNPAATLVGGAAVFALVGLALLGLAVVL